jgi:hypothetical protein
MKNLTPCFIAAFIILLSACSQNAAEEDAAIGISSVEIISFSSDKTTYGSHEEMSFDVQLASRTAVKGLEARVYGIKPYQQNYVNIQKSLDIDAGQTEFTLSAKTPACTSGCGGVYPGPYKILLEIYLQEDLISSSELTINLVK